MPTKFSFESLIDWAKEWLASMLPTLPAQWASGAKTGILGMLIQALGLTDKIDETVAQVTDFAKEQVTKIDSKLGNALKGTSQAIAGFFSTNKSKLGLDEATSADIEKIVTQANTEFFKSGIPKLDDQKNPVAAYSIALDTRDKLITLLAGDDRNIGRISQNTPNREKVINDIVKAVTGVDADANLQSLAASPPKTGMVAMLANIQLKRYGVENGTVELTDATYTVDPNILATIAANPKIAGGTNVPTGQNVPAPNGKNPNATQRTNA